MFNFKTFFKLNLEISLKDASQIWFIRYDLIVYYLEFKMGGGGYTLMLIPPPWVLCEKLIKND